MSFLSWDELDGHRSLSGRLWRKFAPPIGGDFHSTASGNPAIGFFDDFFSFQATTLEGPYRILEGTGCSIEQVACTGNTSTTALGQVKLAIDGNAANDEAVLQWGRGLAAPFKLADKNLAFEARLTVSATTAAKWSWAVGLGETAMGATDGLFVDTTGVLADKNFCGFVHLKAESTAIDGAYKADGQTYQDGAVNTDLDSLHTMTASTFVKLGFRYQAHPKKLEWYVNGALINEGVSSESSIGKTALDAATFPDDVFMTPIVGIKDIAGDTALNMYLDWWACAQAL